MFDLSWSTFRREDGQAIRCIDVDMIIDMQRVNNAQDLEVYIWCYRHTLCD